MAYETFQSLPPFPDDIPTMPLDRLSLAKLLQHDSEEYQKFCRACEDIGFFYLDLRDQELGDSILSDADELFKISAQLFALDVQEKSKYDHSKKRSYYGYKPLGAGQVDEKGNLDSVEFYNVSLLSCLFSRCKLSDIDRLQKMICSEQWNVYHSLKLLKATETNSSPSFRVLTQS